MRVFLVVQLYGLVDEQSGLGQVVGQHEEEFVFEDAVDPLGKRVLIAIVSVGHRAAQLRFLQGCLVGVGGVLAAPVRFAHDQCHDGALRVACSYLDHNPYGHQRQAGRVGLSAGRPLRPAAGNPMVNAVLLVE